MANSTKIPKDSLPVNRVRNFQLFDQEVCLNIQRNTFPASRLHTDFAREIRKPNSIYLVAYFEHCYEELDETIKLNNYLCECKTNAKNVSGFIGGWNVVDEIQIIDFIVEEKFRGHGIGRLLLNSLIELACSVKSKLITLEVRASNMPAINLYTKFGFKVCGSRKNYYSDKNEDALLMDLEIN
ncbi:MAG: ribosomal-protein-alanine N-acetyltransferase [Dehalococcoidia bacterium]|nr:ribosomal-protein-alanine N-acetyltransferase [Dehalococcoidia bacterium]MQG15505.1 ribosomal-protein-alanine N-acetyltransferase [SAR202 cluster bacterium]|tara:strand:+ start:239 stop:787 length:549 start_codon:yes stop_codon:yes gene_type:complete